MDNPFTFYALHFTGKRSVRTSLDRLPAWPARQISPPFARKAGVRSILYHDQHMHSRISCYTVSIMTKKMVII
jgi:hypothetical protein